MFKRLENSKIFTLQNTNTAGKTQNVTSVYYLVEIPLRPDVFFQFIATLSINSINLYLIKVDGVVDIKLFFYGLTLL